MPEALLGDVTPRFYERRLTFDAGNPLTVETMWINPATNLPVRTYEGNSAEQIQVDYGFLPPTPANMAKLNPVIPPGFTKTATIQK